MMDNKFYTETVVDFMESEFELNCMQMDFLEELCADYQLITDALGYAYEITEYGCESGVVGHLTYTHNVMQFLADNYNDIEMYINQIGEITDAKLYYEDLNFVQLVWEAYEAMVADTIPLIQMAMEAIE